MLNDGSNFSYQNIIYAMKGKKTIQFTENLMKKST